MHICVCTTQMCVHYMNACPVREASDHLELEIQMLVNGRLGAKSQVPDLRKNSQFS